MHPFGRLLRILATLCGSSLLLLAALRLWQLVAFTSHALTPEYAPDVLRAFWMGLRFDAKVVSILYLPLVAVLLASLWLKEALGGRGARRFARWYGFSILLFLLALGVVNLFYYQFYQEPLGVAAFGIAYDDTLAVLRSIWTDFPVVKVALGLTLGAWLLGRYTGWIARRPGWPLGAWTRRLAAALLPLVMFGLARGSLGDRPLGDGHSVVSNNMLINHLTMNAPMAAQYAVKRFNASRNDESLAAILRRNGFSSVREAMQAYLGRSVSEHEGLDALLDSVAGKGENFSPPHVLVLQMESVGSYYMRFDREPFNLLGALREELPHLLWFPHCLSAAGGTMISMEGILFGSPFRNISQTAHSRTTLPYSAQMVYRRAGYTTRYITGQRLGWQNLFDFFSHQGFDHLEGDVDLQNFDPDAPTGEWGVHDETLFRRIEEVLRDATTPQFIYAMSISHHTPYDVPGSDFAHTMQVPDSVRGRIRCDQAVAERSFIAFRYAADLLGQFLHRLRQSEWGTRTIVAITGDHTLKQTMHFGEHPLDVYGVPILFYIPPQYLPEVVKGQGIDTDVYASHHDIFPTLYRLSLPRGQYLKTGLPMLGDLPDDATRLGVYDNSLAVGQGQIVDWQRNYYATLDTLNGKLIRSETPTTSQANTARWLKAREVCMAAFLMQHWETKERP